MEILGKILGSPARVKIMKLFLLNKSKGFRSKDIVQKSQVKPDALRRELRLLSSIHFIKKRSSVSQDWFFNSAFKYTTGLEHLLFRSDSLNKDSILNIFKKVGQIKLLIVSGIFIKNNDSRVDLLIVGDRIKRGRIESIIRKLEAEMGSELIYALFDTKEFNYRLSMYDKLIRDILDFPHEIVFQAKELSTQTLNKT
mgnify:CR=1 FL=1